MTDGPGGYVYNNLCCVVQVSGGLEFLSMLARGIIASTNTGSRGQKGGQNCVRAGSPRSECSVDLLSKQEIRDHFCILNNVSILLVDGEPMPAEKLSYNSTYFSKAQFNVGLHFPLRSVLKQLFHFTKITLAFLHPNVVPVLMGCSILDMLYHLDLSLLEVLFIHTIKMSQKERFNLSAYIPSLQHC